MWNVDGESIADRATGQPQGDCSYLQISGLVGAAPPCQP